MSNRVTSRIEHALELLRRARARHIPPAPSPPPTPALILLQQHLEATESWNRQCRAMARRFVRQDPATAQQQLADWLQALLERWASFAQSHPLAPAFQQRALLTAVGDLGEIDWTRLAEWFMDSDHGDQ